jgi:hypothetical protein
MDFCGLPPVPTDVLSAHTSLSRADIGLAAWQVAVLGRAYQLATQSQLYFTYKAIQAQIDAGKPAISLIGYGSIAARQNQPDHGGHFVIVRGYDSQYVYLNDPDWWGKERDKGNGLAVPVVQFQSAIRVSPAPYTGVILVTVPVKPLPAGPISPSFF